jgi:superfamily II DNA or RNA helicase
MWDIGTWAWDQKRQKPVQIMERVSLWDATSYRVFSPEENETYLVQEELVPIERARSDSKEKITYKALAAKMAHTIASGELLFSMLESNIQPLPHQYYALERALSKEKVRYLLADEVGLGKTIEAGLIIRELKLRGLIKRILIIAPKGLIIQWLQEMETKFSEQFQLIIPSEYSYLDGAVNIWQQFDQVITSLDSVKPLDSRRGWSEEEIARYNQERFGSLIDGAWDLVIIDEAHKVAGSTDTVARHKLGKGLADASPYLLLLSATPHQGKRDSFHRLMSLLDKEAFPTENAIEGRRVADYIIRTEKRQTIDLEGNPLFKPRHTQLLSISWQDKHHLQRSLYGAVTKYVKLGYNQALKEKRNHIGFLMVLMQRLVASSTAAIKNALERRLEVIENAPSKLKDDLELDEEWWELDGQEQYDQLFAHQLAAFVKEHAEVRELLSLARRCENEGPDTKAEALLEWLFKLMEEEGADSKFLIFTEFISTQQMLAEFLENRGFSVVCLNGTKTLEERRQIQAEFAKDTQIMISTDAGGEGLNLQFCHLVINYDLPWNPMRLEQRIGRVDRIGQTKRVQALNFLLAESIEWRVQEVLIEKLEAIATDFGVDKMHDVLDSPDSAGEIEELYKKAILAPEKVAEEAEALDRNLRTRVREITKVNRILGSFGEIKPDETRIVASHPASFWLEQMTLNYLLSEGESVEQTKRGYDLSWPDGLKMENVTFSHKNGESNYLSFEEPRVRALIERIPFQAKGSPISVVTLEGLSDEICGYWALWKLFFPTNSLNQVRFFPVFKNDDGRVFPVTAQRIWEQLLTPSNFTVVDQIPAKQAGEVFAELQELAIQEGEPIYRGLKEQYQRELKQTKERGYHAYQLRRQIIERHGLPNVRASRLRKLEAEQRARGAELHERWQLLPELGAVAMMKVGN